MNPAISRHMQSNISCTEGLSFELIETFSCCLCLFKSYQCTIRRYRLWSITQL